MPQNILIIGATRGLGASLANAYASQPDTTVFGTTRSATAPIRLDNKIIWIPYIDVSESSVGAKLVNQLGSLGGGGRRGGMTEEGWVTAFDIVIITAGYFATEDFKTGPKWDEEVKMYTTSSISPPFIVQSLFKAKRLTGGSRVRLISSESGSIGLRHAKEGGGNYAHHASKAALNMVDKLTEMTAGVGFHKYWDDGGAVTPGEAAKTLVEWAEKLDMSKSGQYWAPRGPRDIGTADVAMGTNLPTPLQLPW
ncbi:oxidoreductase-like protein [Hyaloscypha sp. PMI_1271]|nr:oxidoreductase-like protein [Hyaloscypha sp. PMI_1271]